MSGSTNEESMICNFYYPKVAYLIVVSVTTIFIAITLYLSYVIKDLWKGQAKKKTIQRIQKFHEHMFMITMIVSIFAIGFSTIVGKICFHSQQSNILEQQYLSVILVLVSYLMDNITSTLLFTSISDKLVSKYIIIITFLLKTTFHSGFMFIAVYWMEYYHYELNQVRNIMSIVTIISISIHCILWLVFSKLFGGFCIKTTSKPSPSTNDILLISVEESL